MHLRFVRTAFQQYRHLYLRLNSHRLKHVFSCETSMFEINIWWFQLGNQAMGARVVGVLSCYWQKLRIYKYASFCSYLSADKNHSILTLLNFQNIQALFPYLNLGGSIGSFWVSTIRMTRCFAPELNDSPCCDGVYRIYWAPPCCCGTWVGCAADTFDATSFSRANRVFSVT